MPLALDTKTLRVRFGESESRCGVSVDSGLEMGLNIPVLGEVRSEPLCDFAARSFESGAFHLMEGRDGLLAGCMVLPKVSLPLEWSVYQTYRDLFEILDGRSLYRVWNYVPQINGETEGLENYRSFNIGRFRAFEECYGDGFEGWIPAASALGIDENTFALAFVAGQTKGVPIENPEQTPAYEYPGEYGPKSPSFARGLVADINGRRTGFLSGTSSVKGCETKATGDFEEQLRITIENMRIVTGKMGFEGAVSEGFEGQRYFKCFLRNPGDYARAREIFGEAVGEKGIAATTFVKSDICRADLDVEVEGVFG
jgi:chorismate lyase/3-hydroxybenzoate synthase